MFGIIISVIVLITMGYLILKNYKPQVVLAAAGIFLMMCGVWLGFGGVLDPTKSSGYLIVDIYNEILARRILFCRQLTSSAKSWRSLLPAPPVWVCC